MKIQNIFLTLIFCFCATYSVAQNLREFSVVSFSEKPFDTAARDERYKIIDGNGELFSIIKLVSNNPDDNLLAYSFDFGLCESRVKEVDGEVWVYVQRNAMRATIKREGYKTVKHELPITVQPGQVFELVLTSEALPIYREILQFNITPSDVKATIMYKSAGQGSRFQLLGTTDDAGLLAKSLELGAYIYEVHADGYHKSEGRLELIQNKGIHTEKITLRPISAEQDSSASKETAILQFNVSPANAKATIMYKKEAPGAQLQFLGITDANGVVAKSLGLGAYVYEIFSDSYHKSEGRVVLDKVNEMYAEDVVLRPKFSTLTFEAGEGVDIYIDNEKVGTGSWRGVLNSGTYSVECRKEKHKSVSENIVVTDSCDQTITLKSPIPIVGTLMMISTPLGANVTVDGEERGVTPLTIENLLIGEHTIIVSKDEFKSDTCIVDITENKMLEKTVALKSITHVTITTKPKVADLYLNDEYVGSTPYSAEMQPGEYKLYIAKKGFRNFERRVQFDGTEFNARYKLKRQYKQKYGVYLDASAQFVNMTGVGLNAGFYSSNFNMEAFGTYSLDKSPIYVNYTDGSESQEEIPMLIHAGGKMGYGVILGRRFRITPQVGAGVVLVKSENIQANTITALGSIRFECAIFRCLGISVTPEYIYAVKHGEVYDKLSHFINGFDGFGLRVGLYLY